MRLFKKSRGFSMVELLVALSIISLLSYVGFIGFTAQLRKGRDGRRKADLEAIRGALEIYRVDIDQYPTETVCDASNGSCAIACPCSPLTIDWNGNITTLEPNYIADLPVDPVNDATHFYEYEPVCNEISTVCGVARDCTLSGDCCAYRLRVVLEVDTSWHEVCSP